VLRPTSQALRPRSRVLRVSTAQPVVMLAPSSLLRPSLGFICRQCRRRISSHSKIFKEGDVVLVKASKDTSHFEGRLTKPLSPEGEVQTHRGPLKHSAIISQRVRDTISTAKGVSFRLHEPTLSEYVVFTPRIVTPVRPRNSALTYMLQLIGAIRYTPMTPI
jgi:hypothetical protein